MKTLVIKIKYTLDAREKVAEATVPYVFNTSHNLPDVYPFNQNYYFGPDSGTFLGHIYIDEKGRLHYFDSIIEQHDGVNVFAPLKSGRYVFEFEVVEKWK